MAESEIYRPPPGGSYFQNMNPFFDGIVVRGEDHHHHAFCIADHDLSSCYNPLAAAATEETCQSVFRASPYLETGYNMDFEDHHRHLEDMDITAENISEYLKDPILNGEISTDVSASEIFHLLVLPTEGMEIDNELSVFHLLRAYAEAMEMGEEELTEVIVKRISEKVSPLGDSMVERLMYYMFQSGGQSADYLKQESAKNFYPALKAFYQIFPNGKLAHFAANLAILEALPNDAGIVRIFDFDIGEGIQWASLIEAISCGQQQRQVTLTSVMFSHHQQQRQRQRLWGFEDTKKRLCDYASSFGVKLKMEEMELSRLIRGELRRAGSDDDDHARKEWFVFNCMVGLPHMGRVRSRKDVSDFLRASHDFLQLPGAGGIMVLGDGDSWEKLTNVSTYASFLDANMAHYQALLESIKLNFPAHLPEARTAMECLFVAPFVSSLAWAQTWEERKNYGGQLDFRFGLEGWKVSLQSLTEAKEVVREGESLYGVRIEAERNNQIVMDWRGIPLVRVTCWRS